MLELFGWIGGVMVGAAYVMVSLRRIAPDSAFFQVMNTLGALMLGLACLEQGALPPALLNAAWVAFGIKALVPANRTAAPTRRVSRVVADAPPTSTTGG